MEDNSAAEAAPAAPSSFPWPPVLLALGAGLGFAIEELVSIPFLHLPALGWGMIVAALAIDIWVFAIFKQRRTNIRPDRPATALVISGPFFVSRNPIYVGNVMILIGLALLRGTGGFAIAAVLFIALVTPLAILPEERHMRRQFGEDWDAYAARVRRWL